MGHTATPNTAKRAVELGEVGILKRLPASRLARLAPRLQVCPVRAREYLYFDAQPAEHVWIVRSGGVRTLMGTAAGRVTTLEQIPPGGLFGMAAMRGEGSYGESAQAEHDGQVWRLPERVFRAQIMQEPELMAELITLVAQRLHGAHKRLCSFANDTVPSRIAGAVLERDNGERIELTRRLLAEAAGTTVETTIRVLRKFERAGWIEGGVGWIRALDREALQSVAANDDNAG